MWLALESIGPGGGWDRHASVIHVSAWHMIAPCAQEHPTHPPLLSSHPKPCFPCPFPPDHRGFGHHCPCMCPTRAQVPTDVLTAAFQGTAAPRCKKGTCNLDEVITGGAQGRRGQVAQGSPRNGHRLAEPCVAAMPTAQLWGYCCDSAGSVHHHECVSTLHT